MTQMIGPLAWVDWPAADYPVAPYTVSFVSDQSVSFRLQGGQYRETPVAALFVGVDNSANGYKVAITIGPMVVSVPPFQREVIPLPAGLTVLLATASGPSTSVNFLFSVKQVYGAATDQYGISQAITNALAGSSLQMLTPIINCAFQIWPTGTSFTYGAKTYGPEAWVSRRLTGVAGGLMERVAGSVGELYGMRIRRAAADANVQGFQTYQSCLSDNCYAYQGTQVTFALDAKSGANFSGAQFAMSIYSSTGVDQDYSAGPTGSTLVATTVVTPTTTYTRYSCTGVVPAGATQLHMVIEWTPTGVAGADDSITISRTQLDVGSTPLTFRSPDIAIEVYRCEYLFKRYTAPAGVNSLFPIVGTINGVPQPFCVFTWRKMRTTPSVAISAVGDFQWYWGAGSGVAVGLSFGTFSPLTCLVTGAPSGAAGQAIALTAANANATLDLNARI